jgi:hypothetical protein
MRSELFRAMADRRLPMHVPSDFVDAALLLRHEHSFPLAFVDSLAKALWGAYLAGARRAVSQMHPEMPPLSDEQARELVTK